MQDFRHKFYSNYEQFKDWKFGEHEANGESYEIEFKRSGLNRKNLNILEIGFGSGGFLDWCKSKGHQIQGTEVNEQYVQYGLKQGFNVFKTSDLKQFDKQSFDLVVAFDVFEHLYPEEISTVVSQAAEVLKSGGLLMARFPNSISPFSGKIQFGDVTHVTFLSKEKIMQITKPYGFELLYCDNAARPLNYGKKPKWQRWLMYKIRDIFEVILGNVYYGGRIPLDANLTIVLKKSN